MLGVGTRSETDGRCICALSAASRLVRTPSPATDSYVEAVCQGVRQIKHMGHYARGPLARPVTAVAQGTASTRRGEHDPVVMVGIRSVRVAVAHILSILSHAATWFDGISEGQLKWASCSGSPVAF